MRYIRVIILFSLVLGATAFSATIEGALITQIRGITNQVFIRSSSNPAVESQPGSNGNYRIDVAMPARDFILVEPMEGDNNLYSPRILPAATVGIDTLYIIPPTNPSLRVIVDNRTERDFRFIADKCNILDLFQTSQKDYELTVIPHHSGVQNVLVAAITPGYPAVVKAVQINPARRQGVLVIEPQDIGIQPIPPAPIVQATPRLEPEPVIEPPPQIQQEPAPSVVYIERTPPPVIEEKEPPATVESEATIQIEEEIQAPNDEKIKAAQNAYYFSDRLVVKDRRNTSIAVLGRYDLYPNTPASTEILHYGVDLYNLRVFKKYFDFSAHASQSDQLEGPYYKGSLTWHHSPYASIDVAYKTSDAAIWQSQYDVSQTSVGVNGYYKSQGVHVQLGAGVRFQVDYGNFEKYLPEQEEKRYRYVQSFYLIGSGRFGSLSMTAMAGLVNEAFYASATLFVFRTLGINYTFKNATIDNSYFTPLEEEMQHRVSVLINFTLKNREKVLSR